MVHIVSLGHNCQVQFAINKITSQPVNLWSWCKSPCTQSVINIIKNNFAEIANYSYYEKTTHTLYKLNYVHQTKEFENEHIFKDTIFKSFTNKIDRMRNILLSPDPSIFVRASLYITSNNIINLFKILKCDENKNRILIIICVNCEVDEDMKNIDNLKIIKKPQYFNKKELKKGKSTINNLARDINRIYQTLC